MPWTQEQSRQIFENYWSHGTAQCPSCAALIRFELAPTYEGYYLLADCPRACGGFQMQRATDPKAATFRDWTLAEQDQIVNDHFARGCPSCPVDNAILDVSENPYHGGNNVTTRCRRCGRGFTRELPARKR